MGVIDQIQADVFSVCNSQIHGRSGNYYVLGTGAAIPLNFAVKAETMKSVFDTGTAEIDFNIMSGLIGANELSATPLEQGRGSVGDTFIFTDSPAKTWHVRQLAASADTVGSYYDIVLTDYNGPMTGV